MLKVTLRIELMREGRRYFECPICLKEHDIKASDMTRDSFDVDIYKNIVKISKTVCDNALEDFYSYLYL